MRTGKRKIYWDSTCWLAWLIGEGEDVWPRDVVTGLQDVAAEVENKKIALVTSTMTRTEIYLGRLTEQQKSKYTQLLRRSNLTEMDATTRVAELAAAIREHHDNKDEKRKVKTPDAIHLATALVYEVDEFHTMDGLQKGGSQHRKLLALSGNVGGYYLRIVNPYPLHTPPPELVTVKGPLFNGD